MGSAVHACSVNSLWVLVGQPGLDESLLQPRAALRVEVLASLGQLLLLLSGLVAVGCGRGLERGRNNVVAKNKMTNLAFFNCSLALNFVRMLLLP